MAAVTSRYARALADVILARSLDPERVLGQLGDLVETLNASAELRNIWENPAIPAEQKRGLLDAIARHAGMLKEVRNFVAVVIDHRRVAALGAMTQQVRAELNQRLGIADAEITVTRELDKDEKRELEGRIRQASGKIVRARYHVDRSILGGAIVRIGSTIYDGSVKGQLARLREALVAH